RDVLLRLFVLLRMISIQAIEKRRKRNGKSDDVNIDAAVKEGDQSREGSRTEKIQKIQTNRIFPDSDETLVRPGRDSSRKSERVDQKPRSRNKHQPHGKVCGIRQAGVLRSSPNEAHREHA